MAVCGCSVGGFREARTMPTGVAAASVMAGLVGIRGGCVELQVCRPCVLEGCSTPVAVDREADLVHRCLLHDGEFGVRGSAQPNGRTGQCTRGRHCSRPKARDIIGSAECTRTNLFSHNLSQLAAICNDHQGVTAKWVGAPEVGHVVGRQSSVNIERSQSREFQHEWVFFVVRVNSRKGADT